MSRFRLSSLLIAVTVVAAPSRAIAQPRLQVAHRFEVPPHAALGGLVEAADGALYGTTSKGAAGGGTIYRVPAGGGTPSTVHRFAHGRRPDASLVQGEGGVLYGTTSNGGQLDAGTVFRFDPATGRLTTLHAFALGDGQDPVGPVMQASNGLLYGTIAYPAGGRIYELDPATGRVRWLHTFDDDGPLGAVPSGGLVEASNGFLYGVTQQVGQVLTGTVYKLNRTTGAVTLVHAFNTVDVSRPVALTRTTDGLVYGAARGGNSGVFRLDPATDAVSFVAGAPALVSRLAEGADGSLYATTPVWSIIRLERQAGGAHAVTTVRTLDVATDGGDPLADLALAGDGWIYGTSAIGGSSGGGALFRFDSLRRGAGADPYQFEVEHAFSSRSSGWQPVGPPIPGSDGALYGLTEAGGDNASGVVYRLEPATGAFSTLGSIALAAGSGGSPARHSGLVNGGDGSLYALVGTTSDVSRRLIRVTPSSGTVSQVYEFPAQSGGLRVKPTLAAGPGGLYGIRSGGGEPLGVFRFDLATPAAPMVASIQTHFPDGIEGAEIIAASDGHLYFQAYSRIPVDGDGPSTIAKVVQVNPATGVVRLLASVPDGRAVAPELAPNGFLYYAGHVRFAFGPQLRAVHPASLNEMSLCTPAVYGAITGLARWPGGGVRIVIDETGAGSSVWGCSETTTFTLRDGGIEADPIGDRASGLVVHGAGFFGTNAATSGDGPEIVFRVVLTTAYQFDRDGDGLGDDWEENYGLSPASASGNDGATGDPDGDGATNFQEMQGGGHPRSFFTRYLAEGTNNAFFRTRLALVNPGPTPAHVFLRFITDAGWLIMHTLNVPAATRRTIDTATLPDLAAASFSTTVESDVTLGVDRTMSWGEGSYGSHTETAVAGLSTTWFFAEGSTSADFALFYLLQNPHPTPVTAVIRYLRPLNQAPVERSYLLQPRSRTTISVDEDPAVASTDVSAVIASTAPIIAERAMYLSRPGRPFDAGHASAGVTAPALDWFLAEGATGPFFDLFVLIANPNPTPANVTVDYLLAGGGLRTKSYTVTANGRFTIWVDAEEFPAGSGQRPLANVPVSMAVRSTNAVPIIVERTMWWPGPETSADVWYEAHNSPGSTATALRWAVGDGEVGGGDGAETFVLIANPSAASGRVLVRLYFENGNTTGAFFDLPPESRTSVAISSTFAEAIENRTFSATVESVGTSPVPIVVEAATYASPGGVVWTRGGNALASPLP